MDCTKSPKWRKPTAIKLRKHKRASSDTGCIKSLKTRFPENDIQNNASSDKVTKVVLDKSNPFKRKNPFGVSDVVSKRRNSEVSTDDQKSDKSPSQLFNFLNSTPKFFEEDSLDCFPSKPNDDIKPEQSPVASTESRDLIDQSGERSADLPTDWSIKTKVRFLSSVPFGWCGAVRSCDEAGGIAAFSARSNQTETDVTSFSNEVNLQSSLHYWCHPHLPWMRHFPRILPENKARVASVLDENMKAALKSDWCDSMTSVFHLLRNGHCSHFYVCTHQHIIMFLASKAGELEAIVTPTTRGLREALVAEGIEFTTPLHKEESCEDDGIGPPTNTGGQPSSTNERTDAEANDQSDTAASVWLESMGLSKENFPTLDPSRVKLQRDSFRSIDNRLESTLLIHGLQEVQALFNFLVNWRSCFQLSGSQAGIPPTILATCAFKGSTLQSLRCKQTTAKQEDPSTGRLQLIHVCEISGAVMPTNLHRISRLFTHTQGHFAASCVTHEPSSVLNRVATQNLFGVRENSDDKSVNKRTHNFIKDDGESCSKISQSLLEQEKNYDGTSDNEIPQNFNSSVVDEVNVENEFIENMNSVHSENSEKTCLSTLNGDCGVNNLRVPNVTFKSVEYKDGYYSWTT